MNCCCYLRNHCLSLKSYQSLKNQMIQHFQLKIKQLLALILRQLLMHLFLFRAHLYQIGMGMHLKQRLKCLELLMGEKCSFHFHHWVLQLHKPLEYLVEYNHLLRLKLIHLSMKQLALWMESLVNLKLGELEHSFLEYLFQIHISMTMVLMLEYSFLLHH